MYAALQQGHQPVCMSCHLGVHPLSCCKLVLLVVKSMGTALHDNMNSQIGLFVYQR